MKDQINITEYYLSDAIKRVIELAQDGYEVNMMKTYRLGTTSSIVMEKELDEDVSAIREAKALAEWSEAAAELEAKHSTSKETPEDHYQVPLDEGTADTGIIEETVITKSTSTDWRELDAEGLRDFAKANDIYIHHKATNRDKIIEKILKALEIRDSEANNE